VGGFTLREKYLRIFANSFQKDAWVNNVGVWLDNKWERVCRWRRRWFEWE